MTGVQRVGRVLGRVLLAVAAFLPVFWLLGPRVGVDREAARSLMAEAVAAVPDAGALQDWLAGREGQVPNLRAAAQKRVVWAGTPGTVTPLSVVYIHGFSASAEELRPVPDLVAEALGANLYFTRLRGHGRDGPAMTEATAEFWLADVAEALEIGRRIGERVLVISTSTGGPLVTMATDLGAGDAVLGSVFVSPNFKVNNPPAVMLEWPGAQWWMPWLAGKERSFEPRNDMQALHWTTRYPFKAVFPMAAVIRSTREIDLARLQTPALFLTDPDDRVVVAARTDEVARQWGGPVRQIRYDMGPGDDAYAHIIAGTIASPGQTARAVADILEWVATLP